jgi:hypothetical protein
MSKQTVIKSMSFITVFNLKATKEMIIRIVEWQRVPNSITVQLIIG